MSYTPSGTAALMCTAATKLETYPHTGRQGGDMSYGIPTIPHRFDQGAFVMIRERRFDAASRSLVEVERPAIAYGHPQHNERVCVFRPDRKTAEYIHLSDIRPATADDLPSASPEETQP